MIPDRLETANVLLRPFEARDASAVFDYWESDPGWERFNASVPSGFTESDAASFVADILARNRKERPNWAILHGGSVVGVVSLSFEQGHRLAVLGYGVHAGVRGRGFSVEAAQAVLDSAFVGYLQLRKIRAHTDIENGASIRVLEKLGFSKEGVLRSSQFVKGRFCDEAVFGLLREEWRQVD